MITQPHRDSLRKRNGLKPIVPIFCLLEVLRLNWCFEFIQLMKNRMVMGYFRYGPMNKKDGLYDNVGSMKKRIALYEETGNDEILVDVANLCMCEFVNGTHPKKHFNSVDDGIHTEKRK